MHAAAAANAATQPVDAAADTKLLVPVTAAARPAPVVVAATANAVMANDTRSSNFVAAATASESRSPNVTDEDLSKEGCRSRLAEDRHGFDRRRRMAAPRRWHCHD